MDGPARRGRVGAVVRGRQRGGDQEELVHAVGGAVLGQLLQVEAGAQRQPQFGDGDPAQRVTAGRREVGGRTSNPQVSVAAAAMSVPCSQPRVLNDIPGAAPAG